VTTMDAAAARRRHPGAALAVLITLAGVGLAGCETGSSLFASNSAAAPEPIKPVAALPPLAKVAVAPIIGAPDAVAKQIQQDFTGTVEKQRVAIASKDERADFTLRGYIVASKDKNATKVSYIWDVTDPAGRRVNRIAGEEVVSGTASKDPWAAVTPSVAHAMAEKAGNAFAAWLPGHTGQAVASAAVAQPVGVGAEPHEGQSAEPEAKGHVKAATAAPLAARASAQSAPQPGPPSGPQSGQTTGSIARGAAVTAVVPSVSGAPGDGAKSLTAAIQQELASRGVTVSDTANGAFRVQGAVALGPAKDGKQSINIEWTVRDPSGKKLGTVSQKNEIPEGSLDGAWGKTAEQAAGAAAQGIVRLLPVAKAVN
jgi:hypothetical protein